MPQKPKDSGSTVQIVAAEHQVVQYSGPLPPANELKVYEEALPGAGERILSMAERQAAHRQRMESRDSLLGIACAFLLGAGSLVAGVVIAVTVPESAGAVGGALLGIAGMGSIVVTFINSTRSKK